MPVPAFEIVANHGGVTPVFSVTITGVSTTYTTATGGLPFDLTTALQTASAGAIPSGQAPNYTQTINPNDIVGVLLGTTSTNGYLPLDFAIAHFKLTNMASGGAMGFEAQLTNPRLGAQRPKSKVQGPESEALRRKSH